MKSEECHLWVELYNSDRFSTEMHVDQWCVFSDFFTFIFIVTMSFWRSIRTGI